eukprot:CAMPEP_0206407856 /NCGR_PEP_ID=MMETSP0294-20121207/30768_1 /ASSEMBLY_ACC=CAM_ASM_000327 /TAXON_ID=39354 /ORGANISM="Heterosigma akashiwo, Strain CCMP2393" /LENGTH=582 /DNA_ID=CAMNT_0053867135 /DNA_START=80 /DNA_END=1829 /DNA_ORIENTATION=+
MIPNKSQTSFAKLPQNLNALGYVHWKTSEALRMNTGEDDVEKLRKKAKELKDQAEKFRLEADKEAQELRNRDVQPKASSTENEPANSPKILTEGDPPTSSESISMEEKKPLNPISRLIEERRAENDKTEELWGKKKLGDDNAQLMEDMMDPERAFFDRYFPTPLALPAAELEAALRAEVFGPDSAFCVVDKTAPAGRLPAGAAADQVSAVVQEKLALSSLAGRVQLTMMKEPGELDTEALMKMTPEQGQIFQKSLNDPVFVAESCTTRNWPDFLSGLLILGFILAEAGSMAVFSTFPLMMLTGGSPGKFAQLDSLPPYSPDIFQTLLFFQAVIFSTRQIVAQLTGTTLGFPYWIPSAALGGVGSWQSFRKPPKTSRALFDMAMIPTTVGFLGSISLLVTGLLSTASASQEVLRSFPLVPATVLERSLVSGALAELLAPAYVGLPDAAAAQIYLAPAAVVGLVGLYMSAVSMIPLGRTEGARAIRAAWGLRAADLTDFVCVILAGLTFFFGGDITIPFWYIVLLSITDIQQGLQKGQALGAQDPLPQNMLAAADDAGRRALHAASLLLAVAVFLPYSSGGYNF